MLEPLSPVQLRERAVLPDMTYSDAATFTLGLDNPIRIDISSANNFSPGCSVVTVRDTGIVFTGRMVAGNEPPLLQKANLDAWLAALAVMRRNRKLKAIVPASGPVGGMDLVARTQEYLKTAQAGVRKLVRSHKPRENLSQLASVLLASFAPVPGDTDAYMRSTLAGLERLYDDLVAQTFLSDPVHE
jgi:glyoxylase-like metal-dependent hydrolase (beta-lactamase superfamily II)